MYTTSSKTESLTYVVHKKLDHIVLRIKAIQKSYKQINNIDLKNRLLKEYEYLRDNLFEIKSLVKLLDHSSSDNLSISKLLYEKCNRCEYQIFKNKYLFST